MKFIHISILGALVVMLVAALTGSLGLNTALHPDVWRYAPRIIVGIAGHFGPEVARWAYWLWLLCGIGIGAWMAIIFAYAFAYILWRRTRKIA